MKFTKNGQVLANEIADTFHYVRTENAIKYLYAICKAKKNQIYDLKKYLPDASSISKDDLTDVKIKEYANAYTSEDIATACEVLFLQMSKMGRQNGFEVTPAPILNLTNTLMPVCKGDSVADFGSGTGDYTLSVADDGIQIEGIEINPDKYELAKMRCEMLGKNVTFINGNVFYTDLPKYDKVFINAPFGMRAKALIVKDINEISGISFNGITSGDWLFALKGLEHIKNGGKVVSVVTLGSLYNVPDGLVRKQLIESGYIEAVILLPKKLFYYASIPTAVVVFSKSDNKNIKMVDASHCYKSERRMNTITGENIQTILSYLENDGEHSITISIADIDEESYILDPNKYLVTEQYAENEESLSDYVQITRAGRFSASELDEYITVQDTPCKCLTIANAQEMLIGGDYSSFKEIPPKAEKFVVKQHNIILSRAGNPDFKASLFEETAGQTMIANGNFYIIEVDENKLDPYYLLAFFNSQVAQKRLSASATGAIVKMLPTEAIKALKVPIEDIQTQHKIGMDVKKKLEQINELKTKIICLSEEIQNVFD